MIILKKEIVAFLNSEGGIIYVGVNDKGKVLGIDYAKQDEYDNIISSWVRDVFYPNISPYIKFFSTKIMLWRFMLIEELKSHII